MTRTHTVLPSPLGPLTVVREDEWLVGLYFDGQRHRPDQNSFGVLDPAGSPALREQLDAYFRGELTDFETPLHLAGTPFQQRVWAALREVPYGETATYGELAREVGQPTAARAVGAANGRNPVCLVVPCHRVVGAGGSLTGYAGGTDRKRHLLDLERQDHSWTTTSTLSASGSVTTTP